MRGPVAVPGPEVPVVAEVHESRGPRVVVLAVAPLQSAVEGRLLPVARSDGAEVVPPRPVVVVQPAESTRTPQALAAEQVVVVPSRVEPALPTLLVEGHRPCRLLRTVKKASEPVAVDSAASLVDALSPSPRVPATGTTTKKCRRYRTSAPDARRRVVPSRPKWQSHASLARRKTVPATSCLEKESRLTTTTDRRVPGFLLSLFVSLAGRVVCRPPSTVGPVEGPRQEGRLQPHRQVVGSEFIRKVSNAPESTGSHRSGVPAHDTPPSLRTGPSVTTERSQ